MMYERQKSDPGQPESLLAAYVIGGLGAAVVIALGLMAAIDGGWLQHAQSELRTVQMPGMPDGPRADDVLQALGRDARSISDFTSSSFRQPSEELKKIGEALHPSLPNKRD
jgi:hypothetical protein